VSLAAYVARRLLLMVPVVLGVTILVFFLIHLVPGDPARTMLGTRATPDKVRLLHEQWGLDEPLPVQYQRFMGRLVRGDLGNSLFYSVSAGRLVLERLPVTLWLIGLGALFSVLIAVPLAVLAAARRDRPTDHAIRAVPLVGLGFPAFWIGIMLLLAFAVNSGSHFPVGGYGEGFVGHLHSMILPALTVALGIAPILVRSLRVSLLEILESDYIATARSKGLTERRVLVRHALRNGIISMISVLAVSIGFLVGGTLIVEQVFALPGIGQLMLNAILQRDFPVVQAVALVFAIMVVLVYLLADIAHAALDPRVRFD
jgi:peptide/nickel transport system permease protein